jgi:hypothetical protein
MVYSFDNLHHIVTQTAHHYIFLLVISEFLMVVNIKIMVFWDVTSCRLANSTSNLEEPFSSIFLCSEDDSRSSTKNTGNYLPDYTASHPKITYFAYSEDIQNWQFCNTCTCA